MPKITIQKGTKEIVAAANEGAALSEVLAANGCSVGMPCGGSGKCGKCTVSLRGSFFMNDTLITEDTAKDYPACRIRVKGDCYVALRDNQDISQMASSGAVSVADDALFSCLGVAIDIGTTTLEACLYAKEGFLAKVSANNPQRLYGADVISRLGLAREGKSGEIASCIRKELDNLIYSLCRQAQRKNTDIDSVVITGNTAMLMLLTETDVSPLCASPFVINEYFGNYLKGSQLELFSVPSAKVYLTRCISAFVGGDITTAILSADI